MKSFLYSSILPCSLHTAITPSPCPYLYPALLPTCSIYSTLSTYPDLQQQCSQHFKILHMVNIIFVDCCRGGRSEKGRKSSSPPTFSQWSSRGSCILPHMSTLLRYMCACWLYECDYIHGTGNGRVGAMCVNVSVCLFLMNVSMSVSLLWSVCKRVRVYGCAFECILYIGMCVCLCV